MVSRHTRTGGGGGGTGERKAEVRVQGFPSKEAVLTYVNRERIPGYMSEPGKHRLASVSLERCNRKDTKRFRSLAIGRVYCLCLCVCLYWTEISLARLLDANQRVSDGSQRLAMFSPSKVPTRELL